MRGLYSRTLLLVPGATNAFYVGVLALCSHSVTYLQKHKRWCSAPAAWDPDPLGDAVLLTTDYVHHMRAPFSDKCSVVASRTCGMEVQSLRELLSLGAVYHQPAKGPKSVRMIADINVQQGEYLRVHFQPRRYPLAHTYDWHAAVICETEHYVVVHKPAGIPTHATVDNALENTHVCVQRSLRLPELFSPHRLDTDTSGLLLLAKHKAFASWFSTQLRTSTVRKTYRALLARATTQDREVCMFPVPRKGDVLTHHMLITKTVPKVLIIFAWTGVSSQRSVGVSR
jgi:hypothetical protein